MSFPSYRGRGRGLSIASRFFNLQPVPKVNQEDSTKHGNELNQNLGEKMTQENVAANGGDQNSNNQPPNEIEEKVLPINEHQNEIIDLINDNFVTIISASTGSGKTTQVPQFILEDAAQRGTKCKILVAQPRKIAAITIASRVAKELKSQLGELVGFQVGLSKKVNIEENNETQLIFCTTGVILQKLILDKNMTRYSHVILDEVHEGDIDMDLLMTIVREFLLYNSKDTKVILMSATLDVEKLSNYFTIKHEDQADDVPGMFKIKMNRVHKIEKYFLDDLKHIPVWIDYSSPGISAKLYDLVKEIIADRLKLSQNSVLVFLPGIHEIESLYAVLRSVPEITESCLICVLHSSLSASDQRVAFMPANKPKVVLSTNLAESSVTITNPEVDCVIDFCLTKYLSGSDSSIASLRLEWASKCSMEQRAGRTGRTCDGKVIRLIHRRHYESRPRFAIPEMTRCPLETVVLRVKTLDVESPAKLLSKAIHSPEPNAIINATMVLKELGGLQTVSLKDGFVANDGKLTYVGRIMAALPLDPRITKFIIIGYMYSVLEEAVIIGAGLTVKGIFRNSYEKCLDDYCRKLIWADGTGSDLIAMLNAFKLWKFMCEQGRFTTWREEAKWCDEHNLERKSLLEMLQLVDELTFRLKELNIYELTGALLVKWEEKEKPIVIKICIAGAFLSNFFINGQSSEDLEKEIYKQVSGRSTSNIVYFRNMDRKYIGEVYQEQIKRNLVKLGVADNTENIAVTFDRGSTKVFVQFNDSNAMIDTEKHDSVYLADRYSSGVTAVPEKIMPEVYRAVKLKQLGHKFKVDVMSSKDSQEYADKYGIDSVEMGGFARRKNIMKHPELCVLPTPSVKHLQGVVTHIDHCNKFYFHPLSDDHEKIMSEIILMLLKNDLVKIKQIEHLYKFQKVIVSHVDALKRAKVLNISTKKHTATCFTFDYGETVEVSLENIFRVTEAHKRCFEIPERCFVSSLSEISPSVFACPRGKWTLTVINEFRNLVKGKVCTIKVYSCVEDIVSVELWSDEQNSSINNILIERGFAQKCEEIFTRKLDNDMRNVVQASEFRFVSAADEFQSRVDTMNIPFVPEPPKSKCHDQILLQGPISPVQTSFLHQICLHDSISSVNIDGASVNSVFLFDNPGNLNGRLLVAAAVNRNNNGLTLHATTTMPDLPGLPVILAMIFSPNLIFKRNSDRTRYEYVQFGLGADPHNQSYFPKHDCILPVNFELDENDAELANRLRFCMSYLLMTQPTADISTLDDKTKSEYLSSTKSLLWEILNKSRPLLPVRNVHNEKGDWSTEDQSDAVKWKTIFEDGYPSISYPPLYKHSDVKKAKLLEMLEKLEIESKFENSGESNTKLRKVYICPICEREYNDSCALKIHLTTQMHLNGCNQLESGNDEHPDA